MISTALVGYCLYGMVALAGMALASGKDAAYAFITQNTLRWKFDALAFVRECIGVEPDAWQADALILVVDPQTRRLAFKACKGPGKTAVLAWIILWFLACHPNSKCAATSITEANINTNLWPELYKWMDRSPFLLAMFKWTKTRVERRGAAGANWFAEKRTWPKTGDSQQQADALAGVHADDVLFVLDESGGIPQAVMVTAEAVLANLTAAMIKAGHRALVVQSGNPTHTSGPLHRACTVDRVNSENPLGWHVITITGDPDDPKRSPRIDIEHCRREIKKWGRENPWVMVNILGMFPPAAINALLGIEEVEAAMKRHYRPDAYQHAQKRLGIDVARFGDDRTVLAPRQGLVAFRPRIMRTQRTTSIAAAAARIINRWEPEMVLVDDSGHWGHGVIDNLLAGGYPVIPCMYGEKSQDKRYDTVRDQIWMELAEWVKRGGSLPYIPELIPELTAPTYTFVGGKFKVEPKDMIKERLGFSPDIADAYAETFMFPEMPGKMMAALRQSGKVTHDFDPYASEEAESVEEFARMLHDFDPLA